MPVTFDAHFEKGLASSASPFAFASNGGDVAGSVGANSNRVLIGFFGHRNTIASFAIAMTWNGVTMTPITACNTDVTDTGVDWSIRLFGLIAPANGSQSLSASWSGGSLNDVCMGAVSVYGADQLTGWQNAGKATGTSTAPSLAITSANGNLVIGGHVNGNASSTTLNSGDGGLTEQDLNGNYALARKASVGASTTISWTLGTSKGWGVNGVDILAAVTNPVALKAGGLFTLGVGA